MIVKETYIAQIVQEASNHMSNPKYVSRRVDGMVAAQPNIAHYVMAHQKELSNEGIVGIIFHIALINESIVRATGKSPSLVSFNDLDNAAQETPTLEALAIIEPNIASYIASNFEDSPKKTADVVGQKILIHVARALVGG